MSFSGASVTCPKYHHHWHRKHTTEEKLYFAHMGKLDKRQVMSILQNGKCAICDKKMGNDITLDHVYPKSKGGANNWRNYQVTHAECNREKGDKIRPINSTHQIRRWI